MRNVLAISIEVLVGSGNLNTALPTAGAEVVMRTRVVDHTTVDGQVIIVEARSHRAFCRTSPYTVLVLAQHRTATSTQTEADNNRLGIGSLYAEAGITLGVNHRIFLSRLVELVGNEVFLDSSIVKLRVEVADDEVRVLRLDILVEGQRVVVHAEPRVSVTEVPEGHTVNDILVLAEDLEDAVVLVILQCLEIGSHGFGLTTREHQLSTALGIRTQVELCNVDVLHQFAELCDGQVELILIGEVDVVVTLHTDTVDGHTSVLHLLHHVIDTLTLARIDAAIVVVEQQRVGVGLTCKLESLSDELITAELEMTALAIGAGLTSRPGATVVGHGFVHHVPSIDHILITVYHREDMLAQTLVENFLGNGLAFFVGKHPVSKLRVPAEAVTT